MIVVKNKRELKELIHRRIEEQGPNCDLNDIDVSRVKDMYEMFAESDFNGDISQWDVSSVEDTRDMFYNSPLEGKEPEWYRS